MLHICANICLPQVQSSMSKLAKREASAWNDFKRKILACNKSRNLSSIYGSKHARDQASKPLRFTKVLRSSGLQKIRLPSKFCNTHNVERCVTMTDSTGRRLWHMSFQSSCRGKSTISNGWRKFVYDHNLMLGDRLVFTLLSTSHFLVEFAPSKRLTLPRRANCSRLLKCLSGADSVHKTSNICKDVQDGEEYANMRPPRSFVKRLTRESGTHTTRLCRLVLPREFCENHKVERHVTMTNSAGHRLWYMRMQLSGYAPSTKGRVFCISNGWREFLYDHGLKRDDTLVFTLLSTSHFLVEFATSDGAIMLPTQDGGDYPWQYSSVARLECLSDQKKTDLKEGELRGAKKKSVYNTLQSDEENAKNGDSASTPRTFTIVLSFKYGIHTAKVCRLHLPRQFCKEHKVERHVTMTDSEGLRTWHMRMQLSGFVGPTRIYCISNGWREFAYDHSLEADDRLLFTLLSTSHFRVEFADSTRAMVPTHDGREYPWQIQRTRLERQSVTSDRKREVTSPIVTQQKVQKQIIQQVCQCNSSNYATRKAYVPPELTHLECRNADGSSYLQIVDSDSDSEMTIQDEE